jgi:glycosyltransferase involved in cell wall biosynthesis
MTCLVGSLTRAATRREGEKLNILTFPTHERYETGLCLTGHNFYAIRGPGIKDWHTRYAPLPKNYMLLNPSLGSKQIPPELDFDLILSQNKSGQFPGALDLAKQLHLPIISLEHTLPMKEWGPGVLQRVKKMRGNVNVFISEYSREKWGWTPDEAHVIHHGIDTELFKPFTPFQNRKPQVLSVVNDWINRDWCCGYNLWKEGTSGFNTVVLGDTPGLSQPAKDVKHLVMTYNESQVFVNTSLVSPIPTVLMEAMACGCAIVTTGNCMISQVVIDKYNGLIADTPSQIRSCVDRLLSNPKEAEKLGVAARQTILERFSMPKFVEAWNKLLYEAADIVYTGEL